MYTKHGYPPSNSRMQSFIVWSTTISVLTSGERELATCSVKDRVLFIAEKFQVGNKPNKSGITKV